MPLIESPNERKFRRPICITLQQLKQLDQIIDKYSPKFLAESERLLEEAVETRFNRYYRREDQTEQQVTERKAKVKRTMMTKDGWGRESRSVVISLSHGRELEVQNFTEAAEYPGLDSEIPLGFTLWYKVYPLSVRLSFGDSWNQELQVTAKPDNSDLAQAMFGSLCHWAKDVAAPFWQQKWRQLRALFVWLLITLLCFGTLAVLDTSPDQSANRQQAHKLLDHGIDASNQSEAISLILAIQSDYSSKPTINRRARAYVGILVFILVILSLSPGNVVGLWRGKAVLTVYRGWARFVSITIPLFLIGAFIRPWIINWLTNLF